VLGSGLRPARAKTTTAIALFLDIAQIGRGGAGVFFVELEGRHVGMAGRQAALKVPGKVIEIETAAKLAKGRRRFMRALAGFADGVTARAVAIEQRATAFARALREPRRS